MLVLLKTCAHFVKKNTIKKPHQMNDEVLQKTKLKSITLLLKF